MTRNGRFSALLAFVVALAATPGSAAAEICEDLWLSRNEILHRAGYCFGSPLGKAVFGNQGCHGPSPALTAAALRQVAAIQRREKQEQCAVDTARRTLPLADLAVRRQLIDLPIRDAFESACIGWKGPKAPLSAGRDPAAPIVGGIEPGDAVLLSHVPVGDWSYVTVRAAGQDAFKSAGWARSAAFDEKNCAALAG